MKINEIDKIIKAFDACQSNQYCGMCPLDKNAYDGKCRNVLNQKIMEALKRLRKLEISLYTVHVSNIESATVFEHFIVKDEDNNNEIRLHNACRRNGISTIAQFAETDPKVFMRMRNVGRKLIAITEEKHKEARELLGLDPIEFDPGDITFILDMKHYPEGYKKSHGYYD